MNFWEARQAALEGKKVRRVSNGLTYKPEIFLTATWEEPHFKGEWEIVEEPSPIVQFVNIYPKNILPWVTHSSLDSANAGASRDRLACLEIIVDEKGKLISARNV